MKSRLTRSAVTLALLMPIGVRAQEAGPAEVPEIEAPEAVASVPEEKYPRTSAVLQGRGPRLEGRIGRLERAGAAVRREQDRRRPIDRDYASSRTIGVYSTGVRFSRRDLEEARGMLKEFEDAVSRLPAEPDAGFDRALAERYARFFDLKDKAHEAWLAHELGMADILRGWSLDVRGTQEKNVNYLNSRSSYDRELKIERGRLEHFLALIELSGRRAGENAEPSPAGGEVPADAQPPESPVGAPSGGSSR